jgi:hypothetical protein
MTAARLKRLNPSFCGGAVFSVVYTTGRLQNSLLVVQQRQELCGQFLEYLNNFEWLILCVMHGLEYEGEDRYLFLFLKLYPPVKVNGQGIQ